MEDGVRKGKRVWEGMGEGMEEWKWERESGGERDSKERKKWIFYDIKRSKPSAKFLGSSSIINVWAYISTTFIWK